MSAKEILKKEYPTIYNAYKEIADEQFELFLRNTLAFVSPPSGDRHLPVSLDPPLRWPR